MKINIRGIVNTLAIASCLTLVSLNIGDASTISQKNFDLDNSNYLSDNFLEESTESETDYINNDLFIDDSASSDDELIIDNSAYFDDELNTYDNFNSMIVPGVRVTTDSVNIRSEANTFCDIISVANEDDVFKMISKYNDEWYQIKYDGEIAYINSEYVEETNTIDSDIIDVRYMNTDGPFYDLNLNYVDDLLMYECVEVYGEKDDKYFVSINGNIGYVSKELTGDLTDKCAVVDISSQTLTLYDSNEKILTTSVVTGKDSTPSDIGLFDVDDKQMDTNLTDYATYDVPVDYWIPYNGGEGIHDTYWRYSYGGEIYHDYGSHGCINTPYDAVSKIYDTLEIGSHVLVKH